MAAKRYRTVLNAQGNGVENIAVADSVIGELLAQLGLQFGVGNGRAGHPDVVADGGNSLDLVNPLVGVHFVLVKIHGAGERRYAVLHIDLHVLEL